MKILVGGALGHIGSHLIRALPKMIPGVEIVMIDNMMTQRYASLFELPAEARYSFVEGDVAKIDLRPLLEDCDLAIALAAITDAANSFANAAELEANNLSATKALAEACADTGVPLVFPSSTSVYGTQEEVIDDGCSDDALRPQSPYARTKLAEERLIAELVERRGLRAAICRFGTIYGVSPGMRFHTAVNKFCWQAVLGQPITVWTGAYDQRRPYLDLEDCGRAVRFIAENGLFDGRVYNVVTANHTVREVVDTIRSFVPQLKVTYVDSPIMNQLSYEVRASRLLERGFAPSGSLQAGIGNTVSLLCAANGGAAAHRLPPLQAIKTKARVNYA